MRNKCQNHKGQSLMDGVMTFAVFLALAGFIIPVISAGLTGHYKSAASGAGGGELAEAGQDAGATTNTSSSVYALTDVNGWTHEVYEKNESKEVENYKVDFSN